MTAPTKRPATKVGLVLYFLPNGSLTIEAARPATVTELRRGADLYTVSGNLTVESLKAATAEQIRRALVQSE